MKILIKLWSAWVQLMLTEDIADVLSNRESFMYIILSYSGPQYSVSLQILKSKYL